MEVVLTGEVIGVDRPYALQWQYSPDGGETVYDVEGATELTYRYVADEASLGYVWRLSVILLDPAD